VSEDLKAELFLNPVRNHPPRHRTDDQYQYGVLVVQEFLGKRLCSKL
jgi:hypothetical protein